MSASRRAFVPRDVLVLYNRPSTSSSDPDHASEAGVLASVSAVSDALSSAGHRVRSFGAGDDLSELQRELTGDRRPDVVFNLCEAFAGRAALEPAVASLCDLASLPYTGCASATLALARDKVAAKRVLRGAGVRTPDFFVVEPGADVRVDAALECSAQQPWIVKPADEDASLGLSQASVAVDLPALRREIAAARARWGRVLVERFIDGREFNVAVLDAPEPTALPLSEIDFQPTARSSWKLITYDAKWTPDSDDFRATPVLCPAQVDDSLARELQRVALETYALLGGRDFARIDLRVDAQGLPYVLELNPNPDLDPQAGFARALAASGRSYSEFVGSMVERAASRAPVAKVERPSREPLERRGDAALERVSLRTLEAGDVDGLVQILRDCAVFRPDEVEVGREVLVEAADAGPAGHYQVRVATLEGRAVGWACFGRVPMTDHTWDLYWIAVAPSVQGSGVGAALMAECEARVGECGARWLLAETSGSEIYTATRRFYLHRGYERLESVPDYYAAADARVLFGKRFDLPHSGRTDPN